MIVRPAAWRDVWALRLLFGKLVAEQQAQYPQRDYPGFDAEELDNFTMVCAQHVEKDPNFLAWIAWDATGMPVGFLAGEIASRAIWKPHTFASPHWLYIEPQARGQGVARALVAAGLSWLTAQGIQDVELAALPEDDQWARRGWRPVLVRYAASITEIATALLQAAVKPAVVATAPPAAPVAEAVPSVPVPPVASPSLALGSKVRPVRKRARARRRRPRPSTSPNGLDRAGTEPEG